MKRFFPLCFSLLVPYWMLNSLQHKLHAQPVWYFGNGAGLNFSSGKTIQIQDGKLFTLEGCSAGFDENNNLVLYSDGKTVWNSNHEIIQNGTELNGHYSSSQSCLIIPAPNKKNLYYIFTADEKGGDKGLCYSVVDMQINSRKGSIIKKNVPLLPYCEEKITAVAHSNKRDIWIITQKTESLYAFLLTQQGIQSPIISATDLHVSDPMPFQKDNRHSIGEMCASFDGKRIAAAACYRTKDNLIIYDFDAAAGKATISEKLSLEGFLYGVCFSSDNTKLYVSFLKGKNGVMQYDFTDKTFFPITANESENSFGALRLGKDGKIYVARVGEFLDRIDFPNQKGKQCGYTKNAIDLFPKSSNFGLPNVWVPSAFLPSHTTADNCQKILQKPFSSSGQKLATEISVCSNEYVLDAKNPGSSYLWALPKKRALTTREITADTSGIYRVLITSEGCEITDSIRLNFRKDRAVFRYLPKFNPQNDFVNSEFYYTIDEVLNFELKVFDKKKQVLFETKNPNAKWNGKDKKGKIVPTGEYSWQVKYLPKCPLNNKVITKEGKVKVELTTSPLSEIK